MSSIRQGLLQLGLQLPPANPTVYSYQPAIRHEQRIHIAGQIPKVSQDTLTCYGKVGSEVPEQEAHQAVQTSMLNALAWIDELTREDQAQVAQILRVNFYFQVPSTPQLILSRLADTGSNLLKQLFGERGNHPRSVIGVSELPRNSPVLLDMDVALMNRA